MVYLVSEEQVLLHSAEASRDGEQLFLLLVLSGQVGKEHHLAALTFDLPGRPVGGPLVLLSEKQRRSQGVGQQRDYRRKRRTCTSITSSLLDR